jgi:hypothetical protein
VGGFARDGSKSVNNLLKLFDIFCVLARGGGILMIVGFGQLDMRSNLLDIK